MAAVADHMDTSCNFIERGESIGHHPVASATPAIADIDTRTPPVDDVADVGLCESKSVSNQLVAGRRA